MKLNFNENEYVEINVVEDGTVGIPFDCAIEVKLNSEASIGAKQTWIDGIELQGFLKELEVLDKTLNGRAVLSSESPGEFYLELKSVDSLGHFALIVSVGRTFFIQSEVCEAKAMNAFPLDAMGASKVCKNLVNYFNQQFKA